MTGYSSLGDRLRRHRFGISVALLALLAFVGPAVSVWLQLTLPAIADLEGLFFAGAFLLLTIL